MECNIWDVQASVPYEVTDKDGTTRRITPQHVNKQLHVLTTTMESAIGLVREQYPEATLHQVIKRNRVSDVIVDLAVAT
jgi:hypothetical protein